MKFKFFQALGCVIFNKSYFLEIQANSKAKYSSLEKEVKALKLKNSELTKKGNEELLKRISVLQGLLKEERFQKELIAQKYDRMEEAYKSEIKSMQTTIVSDNYLIRDLWNLLRVFEGKELAKDVKSLTSALDNCKSRVNKTLQYVKEVKKVKAKKTQSTPPNNLKKVSETDVSKIKTISFTDKVDVYA